MARPGNQRPLPRTDEPTPPDPTVPATRAASRCHDPSPCLRPHSGTPPPTHRNHPTHPIRRRTTPSRLACFPAHLTHPHSPPTTRRGTSGTDHVLRPHPHTDTQGPHSGLSGEWRRGAAHLHVRGRYAAPAPIRRPTRRPVPSSLSLRDDAPGAAAARTTPTPHTAAVLSPSRRVDELDEHAAARRLNARSAVRRSSARHPVRLERPCREWTCSSPPHGGRAGSPPGCRTHPARGRRVRRPATRRPAGRSGS